MYAFLRKANLTLQCWMVMIIFNIGVTHGQVGNVRNMSCPAHFSLGWSQRPPYVYIINSQSGEESIHGIVAEGFHKLIMRCCGGSQPSITPINLTLSIVSMLENDGLSVFMPVIKTTLQMSAHSYHKKTQFIPLLPSSGVVYFIQKESMVEVNVIVTSLMKSSWPFLVLILLFALYGALCIWAMECFWNNDQFPVRASTGIWEGFWWSLVTMTTVGYGDKAPASIPGRLFTFVHILTGVVVISLFTAAITTVISRNTRQSQMMNKQVAVLQDSVESAIASKNNMNTTEFSSLDHVLHHFKASPPETEGLLIDRDQWNHYVSQNKDLDYLRQYKVMNELREDAYYGIYFNENLEDDVLTCMQEQSERMERSLVKQLAEYHKEIQFSGDAEAQFVMQQILPLSDMVFYGVLGILSAWILVYFVIIFLQGMYYRRKNKPFCASFSCTGGDDARNIMETPSCNITQHNGDIILEQNHHITDSSPIQTYDKHVYLNGSHSSQL